MSSISELIFREITPADFFHTNKQPGTEPGGGGQSYIDIPTQNVPLPTWHSFFNNVEPEIARNGPFWIEKIHSLGGLGSQDVKIGQRRPTTVSIRSQKLFSQASKRVYAWHPDKGDFPRCPADMVSAEDPRIVGLIAGVRIFILKTDKAW